MNKKLVAVAIAGVLAAPLAQAQTANVTLYGRLNMDVEMVNGAILNPNIPQRATCTGANAGTVSYCNTINPNQYRVATNSSRFGLRGTESLGGGLSAIFQIESSLSPDISGGTLAGRDSFIGLQGSWGMFRMGRFHGPYDNIHEIWGSNPTLLTGVLATSAIWAQGFATNVQQFDDRIANSIRWDSPVWGGFQLQAQYGNGQGTNAEGTTGPSLTSGQASNSGVMSIAGYYKNGPAHVGLAWRQNMQQRNKGLYDNAYSVAGSWQFPKVKVGVVYERLDYDCSIATATVNAQNACNQLSQASVNTGLIRTNLTRNMFGVGLTIDAGPGQIYANWSWGGEGGGSAPDKARVAGLAHGDGSSANQYSISYTYPLSKRTSVYAGYNKIANNDLAQYNFGVNTYNIAIGGKPQAFVLGMWHNF